MSSDFNADLLSQLKEIRNKRKIAEQEAETITKRIKKLRIKKAEAENKITRIKSLSSKFSQIHEEKKQDEVKKQSCRKSQEEKLDFIREKIQNFKKETSLNKEINTSKILEDRKSLYLSYKNKLKDEEENIEKIFEWKKQQNIDAKDRLVFERSQVMQKRQSDFLQKNEEAKVQLKNRIQREGDLVTRKNIEKEMMNEVDLSVIEIMQKNQLTKY